MRALSDPAALERKYRALYEGMPVMMHSIDRAGRLVTVSDAWLRALGYSRREVIGRKSTEFLTPESARYARAVVLPAYFRTGSCKDVPYQMVKKNGEVIDVLLSASAERGPKGDVERSLAVVVDVTARKREQDELVRAKAWFEAMVASSTDAIDSVSRDGRLLDVNPAFERLTGYSRRELTRLRFQQLTPREYHHLDEAAFRQVAAGAANVEFEKELVRKDGTRVPVSLNCFAVRGASGETLGYAAVIRDISERKRLEREILDSGTREQSRLGRELHDSLGQELTGIALMARTLARRLGKPGAPEAEQAGRIAEHAATAVEQVRALAAGLVPSELLPNGLPESLRELAGRAEKLFGLSCVVRSPRTLPTLPDVALVHLYRIAQESLTNAAKHARARRALIELSVRRRTLELRISDDGRGIGEAAGEGMGLKIMRHRASMLGGSLQVLPGPKGGTVVSCSIPLPR